MQLLLIFTFIAIVGTVKCARNNVSSNQSATTQGPYTMCPVKWKRFKDKCYSPQTRQLNWDDALKACKALDADLASINNNDEYQFLRNQLNYNNAWIGLNDIKNEGKFEWSDGSSYNSALFNKFSKGEPNNAGNNEDCVHTQFDFSNWNDVNCKRQLYFLCQLDITSATIISPTSETTTTALITTPIITCSECAGLYNRNHSVQVYGRSINFISPYFNITGNFIKECKGITELLNGTKFLFEYQKSTCIFYWKSLSKNTLFMIRKTVCDKDIKDIFKTKPRISITKYSVHLVGCKFDYFETLSKQTYWLFNGKRFDNGLIVSGSNIASNNNRTDILREYSLPSIVIKSYNMIGTYQCRIDIEQFNFTITSEEFKVTAENLPVPEFERQPRAYYNGQTKSNLIIGPCYIKSKVRLYTHFAGFIKNGYKLVKGFYPYRFGQYFGISSTSFRDQGFYQCMIRIPGVGVFYSDKVIVKFSDVSATKLTVKMTGRTFITEYLNRSTKAFKELEREVLGNIKKELSIENDNDTYIEVLSFRNGSIIADVNVLLSNQTNEQRQLKCQFNNNQQQYENKNVQISMQSLDCCEMEVTGDILFKGRYTYKSSLVNTVLQQNCTFQRNGEQNQRTCMKNLNGQPYWSKLDLSKCPAKEKLTNELIQLETLKVCNTTKQIYDGNCQTPLQVSKNLTKIIDNSIVITIRKDVDLVSNIIGNIVKNIDFKNTNISVNINVTNNILDVVDKLIDIKDKIMAESESKTEGERPVSSILNILDKLAKGLGESIKNSNRTIKVQKKLLAFEIAWISPNNITVIATDEYASDLVDIEISSVGKTRNITKVLASFYAPGNAFNTTRSNKAIVYTYFFRKPTLFQGKNALSDKQLIGSNILAVTIGEQQGNHSVLQPITIKFKKREVVNVGTIESQCSFWNISAASWDQNGCRKVNEDATDITCECDHLTNFGIILDVSQKQHNPISLQIITWIGCGISLCGLSLTIITYLIFRDLLKKLPAKILFCLSLSLMALLITFLVGVERTKPRIGCQVFAALIQFFILSTFSWMGIEAFNMYRSFVKIFIRGGRSGHNKFILNSSILSFGIPAVIVIITAVSEPNNLGNDRFCVLVGYSFYIGILLPICIILFCNSIILGLVLKSLNSKSKGLVQHGKEKHQLFKQVKITFACSILLGLTWIFALFAVEDASVMFQWLFTIFSSLQGFFIFVFYTLTAPDIQKEWLKVLPSKKRFYKNTKRSYAMNLTENGSTSRDANSGNFINTKSESLSSKISTSFQNKGFLGEKDIYFNKASSVKLTKHIPYQSQ